MFTYTALCDHVKSYGVKREPRGIATREIRDATISMPSGLFFMRQGMNTRLAILESAMLIGGFFDIELIKTVAPRARHVLYQKQSDYGPRIVSQLGTMIETLRSDVQTRRAILYFNNRDQARDDLACTTSIQFFVDAGANVDATVVMRSSDLVYGFPMDIVMFGSLVDLVSKSLGCNPGRLTINVASLHIYDSTAHLAIESGPQLRFSLNVSEGLTTQNYIEAYAQHAYDIADSDFDFDNVPGFNLGLWHSNDPEIKMRY